MMFIRSFVFFLGVLAAFLLGWVGIVGIPDLMIMQVQAPAGLQRYTSQELYGRSVYIREGCVYCHTQQPRSKGFGADQERFWGRATVPADYIYDRPHLLGTMRTGPDLMNIAVRRPDQGWHLLHLFNARIVTPGSLMPTYPWLFEKKETTGPGEVALALPDSLSTPGEVVVPTFDGNALVAYLLSLNRTYPVTQ